jgi:hypothetical protein
MEPKGYKSLGNTIREAVHAIKNAPTMLPEETIEKLGLTEEDILTVGDIEELNESKKNNEGVFYMDKVTETYVNLDEITSKQADQYANAARGYDEAAQEASHVGQLLRELATSVNRLAKSPHGKVAKQYAKIFQKALNDVKKFKTFAGIATKDLQKQADEYWKDDDDETFRAGTKKKKGTKRKDDIHRMMSKLGEEDIIDEDDIGSIRPKEKTVTVKHRSSGKELVITQASAKKYKSLGYRETK